MGNKKEVRIPAVRNEVHDDLVNIAKNMGVTLSSFLRPKLTEIRDNNLKYLRKPSID